MSYVYVRATDESPAAHASHVWEEWRAYVCDTTDAPDYVTGDSSGVCCHSCGVVIVDDGEAWAMPNPLNARDLLGQIAAQARIALEALDDEHEGDFTRAVLFIEADAEQLANLVRTW